MFSESFLDCECFWSLGRVIGLLLSVSNCFSAMTDCWLWPECYGQKGMCLPVIAIDVENVLVCEAFQNLLIVDCDFGNILTSEACVCLLIIV